MSVFGLVSCLATIGVAAGAPPRGARNIELGSGPTCRLVSQTYGDLSCCESCAAPMLLDTGRWVEITQISSATHTGGAELEIDVNGGAAQGSGESLANDTETVEAAEMIDVGITTDTEMQTMVSSSVPCGACVSSDTCIANGGVVNTWHRLCQRSKIDAAGAFTFYSE